MAFCLHGLRAAVAFALVVLAVPATAHAAEWDVEAIRAIRIENNAAIRSHDAALVRKAWAPNIVLIAGDGDQDIAGTCPQKGEAMPVAVVKVERS